MTLVAKIACESTTSSLQTDARKMRACSVVLALLATTMFAGCQSTSRDNATLVLDHHTSLPPSGATPVNVTDDDRQRYPVLDRLLSKWEDADGAYAGVAERYSRQDGLLLIQTLQERQSAGPYRDAAVFINYEENLFELSIVQKRE